VTSHKSVLLWERWETLEADATPETKPTDPRWEQTAELKGHGGFVNSVSWRADGALLASCDHAGQLMTWRRAAPSGEGLGRFEPFTSCVVGTTFWTCVFSSGRGVDMMAAGGFTGVPMVVATAEMAPVEFERIPADTKRAAETERTSLEVATFFKAKGNDLFKNQKFTDALEWYSSALPALPPPSASTSETNQPSEARDTRLAVLCNMAACDLGLGHFAAADAHCTQVLEDFPEHPKALFRRGTARMGLNDLVGAEEDLLAAQLVLPPGEPQVVTALNQVAFSKAYNWFGLGQDGLFDVEEASYLTLQAAVDIKGLPDVFGSHVQTMRMIHTGEMKLDKDGEQPQKLAESIQSLDEAFPESQQLEVTEEALLTDASVSEAVPNDQAPKPAFAGQGCMQYALDQMTLAGAQPDALMDARFVVPPVSRCPKNNGFIRVLPLLGLTRAVVPQVGDLAVYTTGYVVEKDKIGLARGQAAHAAIVVQVDLPSAAGEKGEVIVQSKISKASGRALRHPVRVIPPINFNVAGGGPYVYFYREAAR